MAQMSFSHGTLGLTGDGLTLEQKIELLIPDEVMEARKAATVGHEKLTTQLEYEFERDIAENILYPPEKRLEDEWY